MTTTKKQTTKNQPAPRAEQKTNGAAKAGAIVNPQLLIGVLASKVVASIGPTRAENPTDVLEWLQKQDAKTIRAAIVSTQPLGWDVAAEPLVKSYSNDQAAGTLALLLAVFVQAMRPAQAPDA